MGQGIADEPVPRFKRICEVCELQSRVEEWPDLPARWKEKHPHYCLLETVEKTIRAKGKGPKWRRFPKQVQQAKEMVQARKRQGECLTRTISHCQSIERLGGKALAKAAIHQCLAGTCLRGLSSGIRIVQVAVSNPWLNEWGGV